ncbi:hypothetical protein TUBRATIS_18400 [Tubulinosema ratisbonensis]|uniref:Uncharacterized protein n=1 Tax=Tubulinosema ratisbonensis TaxID=291195 RepID=A0A437AKT8_9MICR|nr:hypothetical protein TUBRATIS_18400 [Tubulinosema ratisbonensis]
MILMLILTFFNVYKFSINVVKYEEEIKEDFTRIFKEIEDTVERNGLRSLFGDACSLFINAKFFNKPMYLPREYYKIDLKYLYLYVCKIQPGLEKVFLHYKKNDPNNKFYTKYKTNIQLYLDNFRVTDTPKKSNLWYYTVLALVFFGGFFISIMILYFIKNK